ncbi:MAG TPA: hypothetical protein VFT53_04450 [Candidatus Saccharimonadales bacterium]|nr:hypothetical protein [Candidatus Saccharimonadales bacterium]
MLVHFSTSKVLLVDDIELLRNIIKSIKKHHTLVYDWITPAHTELTTDGTRRDLATAYRESMDELAKADVFIAEVTRSSFGIGYQVAVAVQQKKPILLLSREGVDNDSLVRGLDSALVRFREYTNENLDKIIQQFLEDNDVQAKDLRFNFFIDRQIYNYIRWASFKTGKTKSRILRDLIEDEINKENG